MANTKPVGVAYSDPELSGAVITDSTITGGTITDATISGASLADATLSSVTEILGGDSSLAVTGQAAAQGGAVVVTGGTSSTAANAGGAVSLVGGTPGATGVGGAVSMTGANSTAVAAGATAAAAGAASVVGGTGGTTATGTGGAGGDVAVTGGAGGAATGAGTGGLGGTILLTPGAGGTTSGGTAGLDGMVVVRGVLGVNQGAPTAKTVSATLTAAEIKAGIITVNQAAGATSSQQLPLAADMDTGFPDFAAGDAFDFSVINTSTVDAEDADVTTNTGWTLVGSMDIHAYSAAGSLNSSGRFRARKTGTATWVLYRIA